MSKILFFRIAIIFTSLFYKAVDSSYRRIVKGKEVTVDMRFMVHLVEAKVGNPIEPNYDAWLCGGAIVTKTLIITSAACVEDVKFMYAISGSKMRVAADKLLENKCVKDPAAVNKKKIIRTCVPRAYNFSYPHVEQWANIDIAVVQVDTEYKFDAAAKATDCDYVPNKIDINFDMKYQTPQTDAMVLGWGHAEKYREPGKTTPGNSEKLQYSSIMIMDKLRCIEAYHKFPKLLPVIENYMICAEGQGNINDKGVYASPKPLLIHGCNDTDLNCRLGKGMNENKKVSKKNDTIDDVVKTPPDTPTDDGISGLLRHPPNYEDPQQKQDRAQLSYKDQLSLMSRLPNDGYRYPMKPIARTYNEDQKTKYSYPPGMINPWAPQSNIKQPSNFRDDSVITFEDLVLDLRKSIKNATNADTYSFSRRAAEVGAGGICQNDHGGPLVTWRGKELTIIGVASVFKIDKEKKCRGPYLFTSTQCNGLFIDCAIKRLEPGGKPIGTRRNFYTIGGVRRSTDHCDLPPVQRGFKMIERGISWNQHPDGPAQYDFSPPQPVDLFPRPMDPLG